MYTVGGGTALAASLGGVTASAGGQGSHELAVTRDADGQVTQVRFTDTSRVGAGGGVDVSTPPGGRVEAGFSAVEHGTRTVETTATLQVDGPEDRDVVDDYLADGAGAERPEVGTRFGQVLHDQAEVSRVVYDGNLDSTEVTMDPGPRGLGVEAGDDTPTSRAVEFSYLGPPDQNGDRQWITSDEEQWESP